MSDEAPNPLEIVRSMISLDGTLLNLAKPEIEERLRWILHFLSEGKEGEAAPRIIMLRQDEMPF